MSAIIQGKGDVFGPSGAVAGNIPVFDGTSGKIIKDGISPSVFTALPRSYLAGFRMLNGPADQVNDIGINPGACRDSTDTGDMILASGLTKRLDAAWAAGTDQGGVDTGTVANGTWHIWLIKRSDTGVVDALFSLSASAPTMPANYDLKRRIGSFLRQAGANLIFVQTGDMFTHYTSQLSVNIATLGTTPTLYLLTVPTGIRVKAVFNAVISSASVGAAIFMHDPSVLDEVVSTVDAPLMQLRTQVANQFDAGQFEIYTNTSGQISAVANLAATTFRVATRGWIDRRGQDD